MGDVPDWYALIKAAQYLKVAPWELMEQPLVWQKWARAASSAEFEARKQKEASAARKRKAGM